jgi:hypothetical protein
MRRRDVTFADIPSARRPPSSVRDAVHVLLFEGFADPERSRAKVIEAGSWRGGAWRVVESEYAVDALERFGFVPLRDERRPASRYA